MYAHQSNNFPDKIRRQCTGYPATGSKTGEGVVPRNKINRESKEEIFNVDARISN